MGGVWSQEVTGRPWGAGVNVQHTTYTCMHGEGGGVEVVSLICRLCARSHADLGAHLATRGEWARLSLHICS